MKVAVFGLGYVGVVSAACLARDGHSVVGVDTNPDKVDFVNRGSSPIVEKDVDRLLEETVSSGTLRATTDAAEAISACDISMVCVGTPGNSNGSLSLRFVENVCREIGDVLKTIDSWHVVVVRSTVLPGSMMETVIPILEDSSGKTAGADFGVCFNPEFLREGSAVHDFDDPPKTIIGEIDSRSGEALVASISDRSRDG